MENIDFDHFDKVELRVGRIVRVEDFPEARKSAFKVWIDLGPFGVKKSSAQITHHYSKESLLHRQVICVINFPEKQIGPFLSQVLITGFSDEQGNIILAVPDAEVANGEKLH